MSLDEVIAELEEQIEEEEQKIKEAKTSRFLKKNEFYYHVVKRTMVSSEYVIINGEEYCPKSYTDEFDAVPFRVRSIEALEVAIGIEHDLEDDKILRCKDGNLNHAEYDINIELDFDCEGYSKHDKGFLEEFILVTNEDELDNLRKSFDEFERYMNEMSDKYDDLISS